MAYKMIGKLFMLCWAVMASQAAAVPEGDLAKMQDAIAQFYRENLVTGEFVGAGGKRIGWARVEGDRSLPPIVVSVGLSESYLHYQEFIYDLKSSGKNKQAFFIFDLRSQGYSERLSADGSLMHIDAFEDYVSDLENFIDTKVRPEYPLPARVLAHSTGGLIAFQLFVRRPELAEKIAFVAPLFGIEYGSGPLWLMRSVAELLDFVGYHDKAVPFLRKSGLQPFEKNRLTHSEARYLRLLAVQAALPPPVSKAPSVGFVVATQRTLAHIEGAASNFSVPSLVLTADDDVYTSTAASKKICSMMKSCEYILFDQTRHVLTQERDITRDKVMETVVNFLSAPAQQP